MEYNYTALVLRKKKIGETDRLYTLYTREAGKVQSIGRGIRKPQAKLAGHLETLNQSAIIVARRHGLGNIASAITEEYFLHIKKNVRLLQLALKSVAVFDCLVESGEKDEMLFEMLKEYLQTLNQVSLEEGDALARIVTQGFLFRILSHNGYHLEMNVCAVSGEELSLDEQYCFSPEAGGVVKHRYGSGLQRVIAVSENAIKLMRLFSRHKLASLQKVRVQEMDLVCVERVSQDFLQWILK
jgi:DNA repair protein RecO (recombination protein O)